MLTVGQAVADLIEQQLVDYFGRPIQVGYQDSNHTFTFANVGSYENIGQTIMGKLDNAPMDGSDSNAHSDNTIDLGADDDVLVMGTGAQSSDTLVINANFGNDTVVNFTGTGNIGNADKIDLRGLLDTGTVNFSEALTGTIVKNSIILLEGANGSLDTLAELNAALATGGTLAGLSGVSGGKYVFMTYDGDKYSVFTATAGADGKFTVTQQGTLELAGVPGTDLNDYNFVGTGVPAPAAEVTVEAGKTYNGTAGNDNFIVTQTADLVNTTIYARGNDTLTLEADANGVTFNNATPKIVGTMQNIVLEAGATGSGLTFNANTIAGTATNFTTVSNTSASAAAIVNMGDNAYAQYVGGAGVDSIQLGAATQKAFLSDGDVATTAVAGSTYNYSSNASGSLNVNATALAANFVSNSAANTRALIVDTLTIGTGTAITGVTLGSISGFEVLDLGAQANAATLTLGTTSGLQTLKGDTTTATIGVTMTADQLDELTNVNMTNGTNAMTITLSDTTATNVDLTDTVFTGAGSNLKLVGSAQDDTITVNATQLAATQLGSIDGGAGSADKVIIADEITGAFAVATFLSNIESLDFNGSSAMVTVGNVVETVKNTGAAAEVTLGTATTTYLGGTGVDKITTALPTTHVSLTGGAGADEFGIADANAVCDGTDAVKVTIEDLNFGGTNDVLKLTATNDVATDGGTAAAGATVNVLGGKATFATADDTFVEKMATLLADTAIAANEVVFFESDGNTYIYGVGATQGGTTDFLIEVKGIGYTTLAESGTTAGDFTLV